MSQRNREGFIAFADGLKAKFGTLNDDQLGRLRQKARQNYGLTAQETEQIIEDLGLTVINYFEALELTIEELENHSEETVKKRVEDAWVPRYNQALHDHRDRGVERRDLLNKAKNILIDPQKRQIHIAQIKSISEPDPIITFRTGEAATSVGELVSLMEKHSAEAVAALYRNEITQGLDRFGEKHFADVGRAVVGQFSADRRTGFMAMIAVLRGKMRLENGSEAGTLQELARLIDQNWGHSQRLLYNGFIAFWLEHTQRSHFASIAKDIANRYRSKQGVGLEAFVQHLDPKIGEPKLQVHPPQIDFGSMDTESQKTIDIKITNVGRGFLYGDVQLPTDMPGLQVSGTEIQGGGVVSVKLDTSRLTPNETHQSVLVFDTNGSVMGLPVSCSVIPKAVPDVNTKDADGNTPLHFAARERDHKRVEMLLSHGAEVNAKDKYGDTPLHDAAWKNASDTAEILLKNGADINAKNNRGDTPLKIASNENASKTEAVLRKYGETMSSEGTFEESINALREKLVLDRVLGKYGGTMSDVNTKDADGNTPLHFAARERDHKRVEMLLSHGAEVNAKDKYGDTPLHDAARNHASDTTEILLKNGADINAKNNRGNTPLHEAVGRNSSEVAEILLKYGANANAKNNTFESTPLHEAVGRNSYEVAEILLKNGADANAKTKYGRKPLHVAEEGYKREKMIALLRKHGGRKSMLW